MLLAALPTRDEFRFSMSALGHVTGDDAGFRSQPLPAGDWVLWGPSSVDRPRPLAEPYPIFLQQPPLAQILLHTRSAPTKTLLGLLMGDLCKCPLSGIQYVVIRDVRCVRADAPGDHTRSLLTGLWSQLQERLQSDPLRLIGWYHSHPAGPLALSPEDISTHTRYFTAPWHVGLVLGAEGGRPAAAWYRATGTKDWPSVQLPFYELLSAQPADGTGTRRSAAPWGNFTRYPTAAPDPASEPDATNRAKPPRPAPRPAARPPAPAQPIVAGGPTASRLVVLPPPRPLGGADGETEEQESPDRAPSGAPRPTGAVLRVPSHADLGAAKRGRWLPALAGSAVTALVVAAGWALGVVHFDRRATRSAPVEPQSQGPPVPLVLPVSPALAALDLLADSVQSALTEYHRRRTGFDNGRVRCAELAQVLMVVEDRWTGYNARGQPGDLTLDANRAARDRELYGAVDSVESDFQHSACPRP
jgi:hypothetical protein